MTVSTIVALANDVLSCVGLPGGALLGEAVNRVMAHRLASAREILLSEMRQGDLTLSQAGQEDEFAAILYRYSRAAIEGTARVNLRLLAAVAAGQARSGGFAADEFLSWADALGGLRREELILLGALHRALSAPPPGTVDLSEWKQGGAWIMLFKELVPDPFRTADHMNAAGFAAFRSGLVVVGNVYASGGLSLTSTPLLDRLMSFASIETALEREGHQVRSR